MKADVLRIQRTLFARNLSTTHYVDGKFIADCVTLFSRLKCQNCGLYGRAILCPPLQAMTLPQFETINGCRDYYLHHVKGATVFVFKNDGTKPWKRNEKELAHIEFKRRYGRQLKGVENGSAKEINKQMKKLQTRMRKSGFKARSLIAGHCDVCVGHHRCPNRENPPCKKDGLTSLEATGIDVYKMLHGLKVSFEYPALNELTQVTMMVVEK